MKDVIKNWIKILTSGIAGLFFSIAAIADDEKLEVIVPVEHWPPWYILDENKEVIGGLGIELTQHLLGRLNMSAKFVNMPWKRSLHELNNGGVDLIIGIAKTPERSANIYFTTPFFTEPVLLAYSTDNLKTFEWHQWTDLKPYKLGAVRGYLYGDNWDNAIQASEQRVTDLTTDIQGIKMLLHGRIDLMPLFVVSGEMLIKEFDQHKKLRFSKKPVRMNTFHFGISKKSFLADKLPEMNKELQKMKEDGTFESIFKNNDIKYQ